MESFPGVGIEGVEVVVNGSRELVSGERGSAAGRDEVPVVDVLDVPDQRQLGSRRLENSTLSTGKNRGRADGREGGRLSSR